MAQPSNRGLEGTSVPLLDHVDRRAPPLAAVALVSHTPIDNAIGGERDVLFFACVTHPFGVPVMSGGGFDSTTDRHNFAAALAGHDRLTEALHIGDHDPSGVSMFLAFLEDVEAFTRDLGGEAHFTRLAVTPVQITEHRLPTAPPKATNNRAFSGETCQADALPPDVLADILRTAIESRIDSRVLDRVLRQEQRIRRQLTMRFAP